MDFGGPVWHASVSGSILAAVLEAEARRQLAGIGDPSLGEWAEMGRSAFHLRRRLSAREQEQTGPVADIRGTEEARRRLAAIGPLIRLVPPEVLAEEGGTA